MPDKWDIRDRYGGKVGEVRKTTDWDGAVGQAGGAMAGVVILAVLAAAGAALLGVVSFISSGATPGTRVSRAAAVLMAIAFVLPWYEAFGIWQQGWERPGAIWSELALAGAVGLALLPVSMSSLGTLRRQAIVGFSFLGAGGVLLKYGLESESSHWMSFGFYLAFIAALLCGIGGYLLFKEESSAK